MSTAKNAKAAEGARAGWAKRDPDLHGEIKVYPIPYGTLDEWRHLLLVAEAMDARVNQGAAK